MHSVLSYKMASGRGLRDQAAGVIATFNGFGNGHKLKLLDSGHKCVAAKPGVGREPVAWLPWAAHCQHSTWFIFDWLNLPFCIKKQNGRQVLNKITIIKHQNVWPLNDCFGISQPTLEMLYRFILKCICLWISLIVYYAFLLRWSFFIIGEHYIKE